jgi:hypothetical protein
MAPVCDALCVSTPTMKSTCSDHFDMAPPEV